MEPCFSSSFMFRCCRGVEGINLWARYSGPKGISLCLFCGIGMALCGCNTWNLWSKREIRRRNYWSCNYVHSVICIYVGLLIFLSPSPPLPSFSLSFSLSSRRFNEKKNWKKLNSLSERLRELQSQVFVNRKYTVLKSVCRRSYELLGL